MKRRAFISMLGGTAAAWPLGAGRAQTERARRIGVLMGISDDPIGRARLAPFTQALSALGWIEGRNLRTELRWGSGDVNRASKFAKELVALQSEVILSNTTPVTGALQRETKTIPIVFVVVSDPVGSGFVESLPRPGGNITGFINIESSLAEKWIELLKEIAPRLMRAAVMFNPQTAPYAKYYLKPFEAAAAKYGVKSIISPVQGEGDIEKAISGLAQGPGSGLIAMVDGSMTIHRKLIVELAMRHKMPLMYPFSETTREGGLISYGANVADMFRRAAPYVDRILRGTKPADLPVQVPVKFELAVNLKTAKALGLTVPTSIMLRADEVIE